MSIEYSDGAQAEEQVLQLLKDATDLRSNSAIARDLFKYWHVRYHLAPERANLLRHLDFSGLDVLELGAGMGAVSRYLAETAASLTVVEGTEARFAALSERLRDLNNWSGKVANIQDVVFEKRFDVVLLIGVLEYSDLYVDPAGEPSAFHRIMKHARRLLKPDGALIVAIENQVGMKYFGGATEDHSSMLWDGVCGYPPGPSAKTFPRKGLLELFKYVDLEVDEYYPFPDYKMPSVMLTKEMMEQEPDVAAELAASQPFEDYTGLWEKPYPDVLVSRTVSRANLLAEMANSFLFVGTAGGNSRVRSQLLKRHLERKEIAWNYSWNRIAPVETFFRKSSPRELVVEKRALGTPTKEFDSSYLSWTQLPGSPVLHGTKLRTVLIQLAFFNEIEAFYAELVRFIHWSFERWATDDPDRLSGAAVDAVVSNAFARPDGYELFDLEWTLNSTMPRSWFILRNVAQLSWDVRVVWPEGDQNVAGLYETICKRAGVEPNLDRDLDLEAEFGEKTSHVLSTKPQVELLKTLIYRSTEEHAFKRDPQARYGVADWINALQQQVKDLEHAVAVRDYHLGTIEERHKQELAKATEHVHGLAKWVTTLHEENREAKVQLNSRAYRYVRGFLNRVKRLAGRG